MKKLKWNWNEIEMKWKNWNEMKNLKWKNWNEIEIKWKNWNEIEMKWKNWNEKIEMKWKNWNEMKNLKLNWNEMKNLKLNWNEIEMKKLKWKNGSSRFELKYLWYLVEVTYPILVFILQCLFNTFCMYWQNNCEWYSTKTIWYVGSFYINTLGRIFSVNVNTCKACFT
jgi:hypothetical protein